MDSLKLEEITLVGLSLGTKTTNENGRSAIDCGNLWQKFQEGKIADRIPGKLSDEIYAVYHQYEGDHTLPFSYFIGCKVNNDTKIPEGMDGLIIPAGVYQKFIAAGEMPNCIMDTWKKVWNSGISRAFHVDFEVYGEKSKDWKNAEVDIFISVNK